MTTKTETLYRVKVVIDKDARFEECNGEPRPLTETEYAENAYRGCLAHLGGPSHVDPAMPGQGICDVCGKGFEDVPYTLYRSYYGNPKLHIYLGVIVETLTLPIGDWTPAESLWHIDFMRDNPEARSSFRNRWMSPQTAETLPRYLKDVILEVLEESGFKR